MSDLCLIWSYEHAAWWRPGRWGYTPELAEAGIYGQDEAEAIVARANVITVNEQLVPVHEAPHFQPVPSLVCPTLPPEVVQPRGYSRAVLRELSPLPRVRRVTSRSPSKGSPPRLRGGRW